MPPRHKETKVVHRKLGRELAHGVAHIEANKIEIDERLRGYRYQLVMIHEVLHLIFPDWSETKIKKTASKLAKFLHKSGFRWVDI